MPYCDEENVHSRSSKAAAFTADGAPIFTYPEQQQADRTSGKCRGGRGIWRFV
ncbi:MAG: hypothetical protein MR434_06600 [Ruminococcus sp.]|nr:hypothetical protein [Ruminococcus sp.]